MTVQNTNTKIVLKLKWCKSKAVNAAFYWRRKTHREGGRGEGGGGGGEGGKEWIVVSVQGAPPPLLLSSSSFLQVGNLSQKNEASFGNLIAVSSSSFSSSTPPPFAPLAPLPPPAAHLIRRPASDGSFIRPLQMNYQVFITEKTAAENLLIVAIFVILIIVVRSV